MPVENHSLNALRLLIADNNSTYLHSLVSLLSREGYITFSAQSVQEAIRIIDTEQIDLVIADLRITDDDDDADISGFEIARHASQKNIPRIIVSAFGSTEIASKTLTAYGGPSVADNFISKDAGPTQLLNAIKQTFGLTLLHISDLHPQESENGEIPFDQEKAFSSFLDDVQSQVGLGIYPIKAALVTGDISYQCQPVSFVLSKMFLVRLADCLNIPLANVVLTPGNHDINRMKAKKKNAVEQFSKFEEYLEFSSYFYQAPAFSENKLYKLFFIDSQVVIVAFNSCVKEGNPRYQCLSCRDHNRGEHYYGWIPRDQVQQAAKELDAMKWKGLRIGIFHHHISGNDEYSLGENNSYKNCAGDHLRNYYDMNSRLDLAFEDMKFKILLYGHKHKGNLSRSRTIGASLPYHFGAGSFWKVDKNMRDTASYLLIQLSPLKERSRIIMRKYYPATENRAGYWGVDNSITPNGLVSLPDIIVSPSTNN